MSNSQQTASAAAPAQHSQKDVQAEYRRVLDAILSYEHVFFSPPTSPHKVHIQQHPPPQNLPTISSLSLHPVIESLVHLLNCDLPSAHFLCRHAQVDPKFESMFVHGILHRMEGDVDNTRAWYDDVKDSDIFKQVWLESAKQGSSVPAAAQKGWRHFLDRIERYRDRSRKRQEANEKKEKPEDNLDPAGVTDWGKEEVELREASLWEMQQFLQFCEQKFGVGQVVDASSEFIGLMETGNEKHAQIAQNMTTGGEGWREF